MLKLIFLVTTLTALPRADNMNMANELPPKIYFSEITSCRRYAWYVTGEKREKGGI